MERMRDGHLDMRCLLSRVGCDSWEHTPTFETKIPCKDKIRCIIIENDSCMNVIS